MWNLIAFVTMIALVVGARWALKVWDAVHPDPPDLPTAAPDPLLPPRRRPHASADRSR